MFRKPLAAAAIACASSSSSLAETSGQIPPGYCGIVVASEGSVIALKGNTTVKAIQDRPYWIYSTSNGAFAAIIGGASIEGREGIIAELLEGGIVQEDAFCIRSEKLIGLASEPPGSEFPLFGTPPGSQMSATETKTRDRIDTGKGHYYPESPDAPVQVRLLERHEKYFTCEGDFGYYTDNINKYRVSATLAKDGWSFQFVGNQMIDPSANMFAQGGGDTTSILLNITYAERDGIWTSTFVNSNPKFFFGFFTDKSGHKGWPSSAVTFAKSNEFTVTLHNDKFSEIFNNFTSCYADIENKFLRIRQEQCLKDMKWLSLDHPSMGECKKMFGQ